MQRKVGEKYIVEVLKVGMGCDNSTLLSDRNVLSEKRFDEVNCKGWTRTESWLSSSSEIFIIARYQTVCEFGLGGDECIDCLLSHVDLLKLPRED